MTLLAEALAARMLLLSDDGRFVLDGVAAGLHYYANLHNDAASEIARYLRSELGNYGDTPQDAGHYTAFVEQQAELAQKYRVTLLDSFFDTVSDAQVEEWCRRHDLVSRVVDSKKDRGSLILDSGGIRRGELVRST